MVVATRERHIGHDPGCRERAPGPLGAVEPDGLVPGSLLAAEAREELVEVVDDRHAGTAVQVESPVSMHAAT